VLAILPAVLATRPAVFATRRCFEGGFEDGNEEIWGRKTEVSNEYAQQKYGKHEFCYKLVKTHGQNCEKG